MWSNRGAGRDHEAGNAEGFIGEKARKIVTDLISA